MTSLGFENYGEALKIYLARYREVSLLSLVFDNYSYRTHLLTFAEESGGPWRASEATRSRRPCDERRRLRPFKSQRSQQPHGPVRPRRQRVLRRNRLLGALDASDCITT